MISPIRNINLIILILLSQFNLSGESFYRLRQLSVNNGLSQYDVSDIKQDNYGFLWISTYDGLNRFDGIQNKFYRHQPNLTNSISYNRIRCLYFDSISNRLWIGTEGGGINLFNHYTETFEHKHLIQDKDPRLPENEITDIIACDEKRLWVATPYVIFLVERQSNSSQLQIIQTFPLKSQQPARKLIMIDNNTLVISTINTLTFIRKERNSFIYSNELKVIEAGIINDLCIANSKKLFIATSKGLLSMSLSSKTENLSLNRIIDKPTTAIIKSHDEKIYAIFEGEGLHYWSAEEEAIQPKQMKINNSVFMNNNFIRSLFIDYSGTLWMASNSRGVGFLDLMQKDIKKISLPFNSELENTLVTRLFIDETILWIGTQKDGIILKNLLKQHTRQIKFKAGSVSSIYKSKAGQIWIICGGDWFAATGKGINTSIIRHPLYKVLPDSIMNKAGIIASVTEDYFGNIWLGAKRGVINIKKSDSGNHFSFIPHDPHTQIRVVADKKEKRVWVALNRGGLKQIELDNDGNIRETYHYEFNANNINTISSNVVWCVSQTQDGRVYAGTDAGLNLIDPTTRQVERFSSIDKLNNYKILAVTEDHNKNLWVNTSQGLFHYIPKTEEIKEYYSSDGLSSNSLTEAAFITQENLLYIGGNEGVNYLNTNQLKFNTIEPRVAIVRFKVLGDEVKNTEEISERAIFPLSFHDVKNIYLKHSQNYFSIEFASLAFNNPQKNLYQYIMEGYDKEWSFSSGLQRIATYNNIPPGNYTFRLRASNSDGLFAREDLKLNIRILPPPWKSFGAYILYFIMLCGLLYALYVYYRKQRVLKNNLLIEKIKHEVESEANENKIRFYVNITHELRTPLSLLIAPMEELDKNESLDANAKSLLSVMKRNGNRLLELINQFLELRKIDSQNLPLRVAKCNWVEVISKIKEPFNWLAQQKNITYEFIPESDIMFGFMDIEKIQRIFSNILSNSFRFTPDGGKISISLSTIDDSFLIEVADNGCGIPREHLSRIFDRFYQVENNNGGTGIGLELVKRLVEVHKGNVSIESEEGKGTLTKIIIPNTIDKYAVSEIDSGFESNNFENINIEESEHENCVSKENNSNPILLVVEDNEEMLHYLVSFLKTDYEVHKAKNGNEALTKALQLVPDIILSDVMMPEMDGITLCNRIKSDFRLSHIPIILLTAKQAELEGLEAGAVDYIMKPFSHDVLRLKIKNLLSVRESKITTNKPGISVIDQVNCYPDERERKFLDKVCKTIESNISNGDFRVEDMVRELFVSRTQLHRKITALTGKSASCFVRDYRLDKARVMLQSGNFTISEVLYSVGFNSPSYFTKMYKKRFGELPSER